MSHENANMTAQRERSAVIMTNRRGRRSARTPAMGPSTKKGTKKMNVIRASSGVTSTDSSSAFCVLRIAISERWSPMALTA